MITETGYTSYLTKDKEGRVPVLLEVEGREALRDSIQVGVLAFQSPQLDTCLAESWRICFLAM